MIEPALLHLAMLANAERNTDGIPRKLMLGEREFVLHVAHRGGVRDWSYPTGSITAAEAMRYLVDLTRDFLDPAAFDLLPFEALVRSKNLKLALMEDVAGLMGAETFRSLLEEYLSEQRENRAARSGFRRWWR